MAGIEDFEVLQGPLELLKFEGMKSVSIIIITLVAGAISFVYKAMVIWYIVLFAPKARPINWLILLDQVRIKDHFHLCDLF